MNYLELSNPVVTGYKLYQKCVVACQAQDPIATSMDCQVNLRADFTNFTLTATFNNDTESPLSTPFAFSTLGNELTSVLTTDILSGTALLFVNFIS